MHMSFYILDLECQNGKAEHKIEAQPKSWDYIHSSQNRLLIFCNMWKLKNKFH